MYSFSEETLTFSEADDLTDRYFGGGVKILRGDVFILGGYLKLIGGLGGIEDDAFFLCLPVFNREIPGIPYITGR